MAVNGNNNTGLVPFRLYGKLGIFFIADASAMKGMLKELMGTEAFFDGGGSLALDLEGERLGSNGNICIIQIVSSHRPDRVYLVDVCTLGATAFDIIADIEGKMVSGHSLDNSCV